MTAVSETLVSTMIELAAEVRRREGLDHDSTAYVEVPDWIPAMIDDAERARLDDANVRLRIIAAASTKTLAPNRWHRRRRG